MRRVLLDEGVPRPLDRLLRELGIDASAFPNEWKQLSNGALLDQVDAFGYEILITGDKNMPFQQNLVHRKLAVMILPTTRRDDVISIVSEIANALPSLRAGQFARLSLSGHVLSGPQDE